MCYFPSITSIVFSIVHTSLTQDSCCAFLTKSLASCFFLVYLSLASFGFFCMHSLYTFYFFFNFFLFFIPKFPPLLDLNLFLCRKVSLATCSIHSYIFSCLYHLKYSTFVMFAVISVSKNAL